jgi:hypothetical protein
MNLTESLRPLSSAMLAVLLTLPCALAQQRTDPKRELPARSAQPAEAPADKEQLPRQFTFDLRFKGGTFEEFVAVLREASPEHPNILLSKTVRSFQVPPLELRACTLWPALQAVSRVVEPRVEVTSTDNSTYAIFTDAKPEPATNGVKVAVHSLAELLRRGSPETEEKRLADVLAAFKVALEFEFDGEGPQPRLQYHKETGMLFVRGTEVQLELVNTTLGFLHNKAIEDEQREPRSESARPATKANHTK